MSAKSGSLSIVCVQLGPRKVSVIQSSGVSAIQGIEVNGRTIGSLSVILWVSAVKGCPLSGVPLQSAIRLACYKTFAIHCKRLHVAFHTKQT